MALPKAKSEFEWLKEKLEAITKISRKDGGITNKYDYHTALKLITVHYMSDVFTRVAGNRNREVEGFDGAVYVDLFAGAGLVRVGGTDDVVAGSALCATEVGKGFDFGVMIERDRERCDCLRKRTSKIKTESLVINGDSNEVIPYVLDAIADRFKRPIVLVFVDPQGMEIKFDTLKAISDRFENCDFLINVNAQGASRVVGQTRQSMPSRAQALKGYLNEDPETVLRELAEGKPVEVKYAEQVKKILGKPVGGSIKIRGDGNRVVYYLLYYTRITRGGSGYSNAFLKLKEKIERLDGSLVRKALDQMYGRAAKLEDFS